MTRSRKSFSLSFDCQYIENWSPAKVSICETFQNWPTANIHVRKSFRNLSSAKIYVSEMKNFTLGRVHESFRLQKFLPLKKVSHLFPFEPLKSRVSNSSKLCLKWTLLRCYFNSAIPGYFSQKM